MPTIQPADPAARRKAIVMVALAALLGALAYVALDQWLARVLAQPAAGAKATLLGFLVWTIAGTAVVAAALAFHVWRFGRRVVSAARFPPPGVAVVRDTVVLEGAQASRRGVVIQWAAALVLVVAVVLVGLAYRISVVFGPGA